MDEKSRFRQVKSLAGSCGNRLTSEPAPFPSAGGPTCQQQWMLGQDGVFPGPESSRGEALSGDLGAIPGSSASKAAQALADMEAGCGAACPVGHGRPCFGLGGEK